MTDQGYIEKLEAAILDLYDADPSDWGRRERGNRIAH